MWKKCFKWSLVARIKDNFNWYINVVNRLVAKIRFLENKVKNSELGPRYFTLSKIFNKKIKYTLFAE